MVKCNKWVGAVYIFKSTQFWLSCSILIGLLVFQNCKQPEGVDRQSSSQQGLVVEGNGDGYGGKLSYVNYDLHNKCSSNPVSEEAVIEMIDGQPMMTVENCQPITPKAVTDFEVKDHNLYFGIQSKTLFQKQESENFEISEVFCRGDNFDFQEQQREVADVYILDDGTQYFAKVRAGTYVDGVLQQSREIDRVPVIKTLKYDSSGNLVATQYAGVDRVTGKRFTLVVHEPLLNGALLSRTDANPTPPGSPAGTLTQEEWDLLMDILIIENLKCLRHD